MKQLVVIVVLLTHIFGTCLFLDDVALAQTTGENHLKKLVETKNPKKEAKPAGDILLQQGPEDSRKKFLKDTIIGDDAQTTFLENITGNNKDVKRMAEELDKQIAQIKSDKEVEKASGEDILRWFLYNSTRELEGASEDDNIILQARRKKLYEENLLREYNENSSIFENKKVQEFLNSLEGVGGIVLPLALYLFFVNRVSRVSNKRGDSKLPIIKKSLEKLKSRNAIILTAGLIALLMLIFPPSEYNNYVFFINQRSINSQTLVIQFLMLAIVVLLLLRFNKSK